ncbi:glycosyltransferase [Gryllotalpicola sp.]|uniref:glycosyltransferase n=1 Tax=Gryllotalpicola sp. TaxID=1932787 RepID=UPI00260687B7|nr:glycosyltransferase [Gryllotalpicola sp.]
MTGASALPAARYFIAASRLRPGLDGGYTVATMNRARHFAAEGGVQPTLLTFEPAPQDGVLEGFAALGLAASETPMRNLFAEVRARPALVRGAALHPRRDADESDPARATTVYAEDGSPLLRLPFTARADWHRADADIVVLAPDGVALGALRGWGELYRLWVDAVVAEGAASGIPAVVIAEAKQVGELLAAGERDYALLHTVHNVHTADPYRWDSPLEALWQGWFDVADRFDAVAWLTERQRSDAVRRFGDHPEWVVIPHPAPPSQPDAAPGRDPLRAVMVARLVAQKRVADAVRAWPAVLASHPGARLEVYGDGPERAALETLIAELGLREAVTLHGYVPRASDQLASAAVLVLSSRHEGQPLVVAEALAAGTPVVAYDIPYGPADMVEPGVSGELVADGDVAGLAAAINGILGNPQRIAALSAGARAWTAAHQSEHSIALWAALVERVLARGLPANRLNS